MFGTYVYLILPPLIDSTRGSILSVVATAGKAMWGVAATAAVMVVEVGEEG